MKEAAVKALKESDDGNARKLLEASAPDEHDPLMRGQSVVPISLPQWPSRPGNSCYVRHCR